MGLFGLSIVLSSTLEDYKEKAILSENLSKENEDLFFKNKEKDDLINTLNSQLSSMSYELKENENALSEKENEISSKDKEIIKLGEDLSKLNASVGEYSANMKKALSSIKEKDVNLRKKEADIKSLNSEIEKLKSEKSDLESDIEYLNKQSSLMSELIKEKDYMIYTLKEELGDNQDETSSNNESGDPDPENGQNSESVDPENAQNNESNENESESIVDTADAGEDPENKEEVSDHTDEGQFDTAENPDPNEGGGSYAGDNNVPYGSQEEMRVEDKRRSKKKSRNRR